MNYFWNLFEFFIMTSLIYAVLTTYSEFVFQVQQIIDN